MHCETDGSDSDVDEDTVFWDMMSCQLMNSFLLKCRGLHYLSFLAHCLSTGRLVRRDLNSTSVYARLLHCIWLWQ